MTKACQLRLIRCVYVGASLMNRTMTAFLNPPTWESRLSMYGIGCPGRLVAELIPIGDFAVTNAAVRQRTWFEQDGSCLVWPQARNTNHI